MESLKFTWIIRNFSSLNIDEDHSKNFFVGDCKWRIRVYPKGTTFPGKLALYLEVADASTLPSGWTKSAQFSLTVVNQIRSEGTITKDKSLQEFNERGFYHGFTGFMPLSLLCDSSAGYIVNDMCIIEAKVAVPIYARAKFQGALISGCPKHVDRLANLSVIKVGEFTDFRGLGQIEKTFVPLLEEVCSRHPSLIECQQKRSRMFNEWAFTALGRVLLFLQITKGKDMNEEASEQLQLLWEELDTFRFDLTWLEHHVQFALGIFKRKKQVQKLREDVHAMEIEVKRLSARRAFTLIDLAKAEEGFGDFDMDTELGYGGVTSLNSE